MSFDSFFLKYILINLHEQNRLLKRTVCGIKMRLGVPADKKSPTSIHWGSVVAVQLRKSGDWCKSSGRGENF